LRPGLAGLDLVDQVAQLAPDLTCLLDLVDGVQQFQVVREAERQQVLGGVAELGIGQRQVLAHPRRRLLDDLADLRQVAVLVEQTAHRGRQLGEIELLALDVLRELHLQRLVNVGLGDDRRNDVQACDVGSERAPVAGDQDKPSRLRGLAHQNRRQHAARLDRLGQLVERVVDTAGRSHLVFGVDEVQGDGGRRTDQAGDRRDGQLQIGGLGVLGLAHGVAPVSHAKSRLFGRKRECLHCDPRAARRRARSPRWRGAGGSGGCLSEKPGRIARCIQNAPADPLEAPAGSAGAFSGRCGSVSLHRGRVVAHPQGGRQAGACHQAKRLAWPAFPPGRAVQAA